MEQLTPSVVLQMMVYLISLGSVAGTILWRITQLEKKVEKHNHLVERMCVVEQSTKSAHHRIDGLAKG